MLKQRVITALVLLALLLPALFAPTPVAVRAADAGADRRRRLGVGAAERRRRRGAIGARRRRSACLRCWRCAGRLDVDARRASPGGSRCALWVLGGAWVLRVGAGAAGRGCRARCALVRRAASLLWLAWLALAQRAGRSASTSCCRCFCLVWVADIARLLRRPRLRPAASSRRPSARARAGKASGAAWSACWCWPRPGWPDRRAHRRPTRPACITLLQRALRRRRRWRSPCVFLAAMSVVGDLFESLVKRSAGAKDSSAPAAGPWRRARPHRRACCRCSRSRWRWRRCDERCLDIAHAARLHPRRHRLGRHEHARRDRAPSRALRGVRADARTAASTSCSRSACSWRPRFAVVGDAAAGATRCASGCATPACATEVLRRRDARCASWPRIPTSTP